MRLADCLKAGGARRAFILAGARQGRAALRLFLFAGMLILFPAPPAAAPRQTAKSGPFVSAAVLESRPGGARKSLFKGLDPRPAAKSLWQKCRQAVLRGAPPALPISPPRTAFAWEVYSGLDGEALREIFPSKKQYKGVIPPLEGLMELLDEASENPEIKQRLGHLPSLEAAAKKIPGMIRFLRAGGDRPEDAYNKEAFRAALAALGRHAPVYLRDGRPNQLDWPRLIRILKVISEFDESKGYVSFFRIKEAIEEAYALREYILCE